MGYEAYQTWKTPPLTEQPYLSVVIPTYNEAIRIIPTVGAVASFVSDLGVPWELIVSDDGSRDNTVACVEELGLSNGRVLVAAKNGGTRTRSQ